MQDRYIMAEPAEVRNIKVLVVDDEAMIREILTDFLEVEGYVVHAAGNGREAIEALDREPYDLVLSDLKMPELDGLALLSHIHERELDPVVVMMTGFGTVETAIEAMKKGAFDYILKPFKVEEVIQVMERGLERKRLIRENIQLKEAVTLYKLTEAIGSTLSLNRVLDLAMKVVEDELSPDFTALCYRDKPSRPIELRLTRTPKSGGLKLTLGEEHFGRLQQFVDADAPILLNNEHVGIVLEGAGEDVARARSFMAVPLRMDGKLSGYLCVGSANPNRRYNEGQRRLLAIIGSKAGIAIDNARLYEDLKRMFRETIQGLAMALEAKDDYTRGHSDRVTEYSRMIAIGMKLPQRDVEIITNSGLMHDIGKMGIAPEELHKPGKLTDDEYERLKKHPEMGARILGPVSFLEEVVPGVIHHHERWDGQGYPAGLKGEEIPLPARVLAVADAYDAMTSDRSYRKALGHDMAVSELRKHSGTQFDPRIVEVFIHEIERLRLGMTQAA
ncbi:MAG: Chemotaxis response regulator protein-glutamate methylesterase [Myxococcota bacterium]|nr:Chemotaxis response regulator protein-glutamate methylesterase [Myxococcota bacterium]